MLRTCGAVTGPRPGEHAATVGTAAGMTIRGAPELLRATAAAGLTVVLASSVKSEEIDLLLEKLNAADALTSVATSGDVDRTKPAPDPVQAAMSKGNIAGHGVELPAFAPG